MSNGTIFHGEYQLNTFDGQTGHFPGRPILPAVFTIDLSVDWLKTQDPQRPWRLKEVKNAKFTYPIPPGTTILLEARHVQGEDWQVDLQEIPSGQQLASLRLAFGS